MRQAIRNVMSEFLTGFVGRSFGSVEIVSARSFIDEDNAGEVATYFTLYLNDPVGETWPADDLATLQRTLREEARREELEGPLYFDLRPLTPDPVAEDDADAVSAGG